MTQKTAPPKEEREKILNDIAFLADQLKDLEMQEAAHSNLQAHRDRQKSKLREKIRALSERLKGKQE